MSKLFKNISLFIRKIDIKDIGTNKKSAMKSVFSPNNTINM